MSELKAKQKTFVDEIFKGKSYGKAYVAAGYSAKSPAVADAAASRLLRNVKVAAYMREREAEVRKANLCTIEERLEVCTNVIRDPMFVVHPMLFKAIETMNKMEGIGNPEADALGSLADALAGLGGVTEDKM